MVTMKDVVAFGMMRSFEFLIITLLIIYVPNLPPKCKIEKPYRVAPMRPLEGSLALNEHMNKAESWHAGDLHGPEKFAVHNGVLYTSLHSGDIVKLVGEDHIVPVTKFGKPCKHVYEESVCGRPLGMAFDSKGTLYAADAYLGIFSVNVETGAKKLLISPDEEIDGVKPKIFNSIVVASTGDIYWTDSSTSFTLQDALFDMFADPTGRLIKYNPKTGKNEVLINGIHFANGVALSEDESFLLIAETYRNQVLRYYLKGPKAGKHDIFIDGLPGLPDNINPDGNGGFLIPLVASFDPSHPNPFQMIGPFPWLRTLIARYIGLAEGVFYMFEEIYSTHYSKLAIYYIGHLRPTVNFDLTKRVTLLNVGENGDIKKALHATNGRLWSISEAMIYKDHLLLGSPWAERISRVPLSTVGLEGHKVTKRDVPKVKATEAPKVKVTEAPKKTEAPKVKATEAPKKAEAPKVKATEAPKKAEVPKVKATEAPKKAEAPKVKATEAPKVKATEAPKVKQEAPKPTAAPKPKQEAPKPTVAPTPKQEAPKAKQEAPKAKQEAPKPTAAPTPKQEAPKVKEAPKPTPAPKATQPPKPKPTDAPKVGSKDAQVPKAKPAETPSQNPPKPKS